MTLVRDGALARLSWSALGAAGAYDVLRGDLAILVASRGDYSAAVSGCLANDAATLQATDVVTGPSRFYLLRGVACTSGGTYDEPPGGGQAASRDAGIQAAAARCP